MGSPARGICAAPKVMVPSCRPPDLLIATVRPMISVGDGPSPAESPRDTPPHALASPGRTTNAGALVVGRDASWLDRVGPAVPEPGSARSTAGGAVAGAAAERRVGDRDRPSSPTNHPHA